MEISFYCQSQWSSNRLKFWQTKWAYFIEVTFDKTEKDIFFVKLIGKEGWEEKDGIDPTAQYLEPL